MTTIAAHLNIEALRERYVSSNDAREARHFQLIWLSRQGAQRRRSRRDDVFWAALD